MPQYLGSSTPIAAGGNYTSRWVNTDIYTAITGTVFTDQAGTLLIEHSGDASHADASTSVAITASTGASFNVALISAYVRLKLTNTAGSPQTVLRLIPRYILGEMP